MGSFARGQANRPIGDGGTAARKAAPKHRNELHCWDVAQIQRHPNFEIGDEINIRGLAATGARAGSAINGTRPDIDVVERLSRQ